MRRPPMNLGRSPVLTEESKLNILSSAWKTLILGARNVHYGGGVLTVIQLLQRNIVQRVGDAYPELVYKFHGPGDALPRSNSAFGQVAHHGGLP